MPALPGKEFYTNPTGVGVYWMNRNQPDWLANRCKPMKKVIISFVSLALYLGLAAGCGKKQSASWESIQNPEAVAQLKSFVAEKKAQANASTNEAAPGFAPIFAAAERGDWLGVSNSFLDLRNRAGQYEHYGPTDERLRGTKWQAILEVWGGLNAFGEGDAKYSALYANDIIESIPAGSIYFGGTDPGRFLITAMQKNQVNGDPFFTVTQNALADSTYLDYLRSMYGGRIYTPTGDDTAKCFQDYSKDVQRRYEEKKLKPGEDFKRDSRTGLVQITGQVAVMEINGLLARIVFDRNTNQEFYVEESFPLDWMYPYLEPHGIIFKLNRQPLTELSDAVLQRDHDYWMKLTAPMIGDWLKPNTTVKEVAAFTEKVIARHDFSGFTGDLRFVENAYSQKMFSKERSSIAGLYAWRAQHTKDAGEKKRMNDAADFAFRQAIALCPYSPEAVVRYANLLFSENRFSDALVVAETAAKMPEMKGRDGEPIRGLVDQIKRIQQQVKGR
jgi:hypothetical protein